MRLQRMAALDVEVATFHGWCLKLLRSFASETGRSSDFRLASNSQQLGLIREAIHAFQGQQEGGAPAVGSAMQTPAARAPHARACGPSGGSMPAASAGMTIASGLTARRANDVTTALAKKLQRALRDAKLLGDKAAARVSALLMSDLGQFVKSHYEASLRRCGLVDLGDLQSIAVDLLERPNVMHTLRRRYAHVLVDEYQDTNLQQLQIIKLLAVPPTHAAPHQVQASVASMGPPPPSQQPLPAVPLPPAPPPAPPPPALVALAPSKSAHDPSRRVTMFEVSKVRSVLGSEAEPAPIQFAPPAPSVPPAPPPPPSAPAAATEQPRCMGVTVVGDDDQSIYSFRGAQPGVFPKFKEIMGGCGTVTLSQNFRSSGMRPLSARTARRRPAAPPPVCMCMCTCPLSNGHPTHPHARSHGTLRRCIRPGAGTIVAASRGVISTAPGRIEKHVFTNAPPGEPVEVCECRNEKCELDWVVTRLRDLASANIPYSDVAVLYRTHAIGRAVYNALREHRIPCATSAADVFARPDVAPIIAVLRLLTTNGDDAAFRAVATGTQPPLPEPLLAAIAQHARAAGTSLYTAARALHTSSGVLGSALMRAADSGAASQFGASSCRPHASASSACAPAQPPTLDPASRTVLHQMLSKTDELGRIARTQPPAQLLQNVITSRLLRSLDPDSPPHGARLLADELTAGVASPSGASAAEARQLSMPLQLGSSGIDCMSPGASQGGCTSASAVAGGMAPPESNSRLAALKTFLEHYAMSEHEDAGNGGAKVRARAQSQSTGPRSLREPHARRCPHSPEPGSWALPGGRSRLLIVRPVDSLYALAGALRRGALDHPRRKGSRMAGRADRACQRRCHPTEPPRGGRRGVFGCGAARRGAPATLRGDDARKGAALHRFCHEWAGQRAGGCIALPPHHPRHYRDPHQPFRPPAEARHARHGGRGLRAALRPRQQRHGHAAAARGAADGQARSQARVLPAGERA